jgi:cytochrome c
MKKTILCFLIAGSLYACGGGGGSDASDDNASDTKTEEKDVTDDPAFIAGRDLVTKSDCLTCHKIDDVSTGPAYRKVANKYPNNDATLDTLANKIIKGGAGNWGTVPMAAHPTISHEDAKAMAKYILLLKK